MSEPLWLEDDSRCLGFDLYPTSLSESGESTRFRGFKSIFPFREGFKNPVLKLIARLKNWFNLGRPALLLPFLPLRTLLFSLSSFFRPFWIQYTKRFPRIFFVIAKDLLSFSLSYGASVPPGPSSCPFSGLSSSLSSSVYSGSYFCSFLVNL